MTGSAELLDAVVGLVEQERRAEVRRVRDRLEPLWQLQRVLEQVRHHRRRFDMRSWTSGSVDDRPVHTCRTQHCVGGWMCVDDWFRSRGLRMHGDTCPVLHDHTGRPVQFEQRALATLLGVDLDTAEDLFMDMSATLEDQRLVLRGIVLELEHQLEHQLWRLGEEFE